VRLRPEAGLAAARVHGAVIQGFDPGVQVRIDAGSKDSGPVKIEAKVEQPAGSQA